MLSRATLNARPSSGQLLKRLLDAPHLAERVQALPAPVLGRLINEVGLADAGELVALATTEQLAEIFDHDLWRSPAPGVDERFDSGRFLLWLEVMAEAGERFVAARLAELPQDLLTLAVHRHVLVLSLADLERELAGDDDAFDAQKAFESCLTEELDDYQLIWRGGEGWDRLLAALLALDEEHHGLVVRLLERCAALSSGQLDDQGGLYDVLSSERMLEEDVAGAREERRAEAGFVAPSAARAFLRLASGPANAETPFTEHDPLTRAYFRRLGNATDKAAPPRASAGRLLPGMGATSAEPLLIQALRVLSQDAPATFTRRAEELSYLANVFLAGGQLGGRRLRPIEAVELALQAADAGLRHSSAQPANLAAAVRTLRRYPCDGLLRLAFAARAELPEIERLIDALEL